MDKYLKTGKRISCWVIAAFLINLCAVNIAAAPSQAPLKQNAAAINSYQMGYIWIISVIAVSFVAMFVLLAISYIREKKLRIKFSLQKEQLEAANRKLQESYAEIQHTENIYREAIENTNCVVYNKLVRISRNS